MDAAPSLGLARALPPAIGVFAPLRQEPGHAQAPSLLAPAHRRHPCENLPVCEGMPARIVRCNPGTWPCVRINEAVEMFESGGQADYRVLRGY